MADEVDVEQDVAAGDHEPRECMPCGGSGQVISNLGGTPSKVTCPWCDGGGIRRPGSDAQERWKAERASAGESRDADGEAASAPESSGSSAAEVTDAPEPSAPTD